MPKRVKQPTNTKHISAPQAANDGERPVKRSHKKKALPPALSEYMAEIGRKGGKRSGKNRMINLSQEQRSEIAMKAAKARWAKRGTSLGVD